MMKKMMLTQLIFMLSAHTFALAQPAKPASAPETFEQMCTRKMSGYGKIASVHKIKAKGEGLSFEIIDNGRSKTGICSVNERGVLTFTVKDTKKNKKTQVVL